MRGLLILAGLIMLFLSVAVVVRYRKLMFPVIAVWLVMVLTLIGARAMELAV